MDNNVKVNLNVTSNGTTDKETKKAKELAAALDLAAKNAGRVGTAGSRAVAAKAAPQGTTSQTMFSAAQVQQYGQMRGSAEQTGASARDFANQAQGLGGLVRLYATYAANVFAVGMAFRALSNAMDTTNMIKGLNQLGASSGVALGALSKQLVSVTGGAISLREAMSATVKVTQAGLGSETVLRLGQVATKASRALGVDMTDAISRLSRGITKLEPELLDELGLFTKIDPAVEKYALKVGKAATQLTDFERRQAFANAILEEGEKKFAAIDIDANPYNKLAASLANIAQSGLELVNNVLGPIVDLLSRNPTALVTALIGVGAGIIKQAVPAFGLFRQNLQQANQEANAAAQARAKDSVSIRADLNGKLKALAQIGADNELKAFEEAEKGFKAYVQNIEKAKGKGSTGINRLLASESAFAIQEKDIRATELEAVKLRQKGLDELAVKYETVAASARKWIASETKAVSTLSQLDVGFKKDLKNRLTVIGLNNQLAESAEKASFKDQVVANTRYNASLIGPINAIKLMRAELALSDTTLNRFSKGLLIGRASLAAFAGIAATVGTVLLSAFATITAIIGVVSVLASLFTKTAKESKATSEALSELEEKNKTLTLTLERLNKLSILEQFKPENIQASATAVAGLGDSITKAINAANKEISKMGSVDIFTNWISKAWDGDVESKLTKELGDGISGVFKALEGSKLSAELSKALQSLLKIDDATVRDSQKLQAVLDNLTVKNNLPVLLGVSKIVKDIGNEAAISAAKITELVAAFDKTDESFKKFANEFISQDAFTTFGQDLINDFYKLSVALDDPEKKLEAIVELANRAAKTGIDSGLVVSLQNLKQTAQEAQVAQKQYNDATAELIVLQEKLNKVDPKLFQYINSTRVSGTMGKSVEELKELLTLIQQTATTKGIQLEIVTKLKTEIEQQENTLNTSRLEVFKRGADIVSSKLASEWAKAGATIKNAYASILSGTEAGIKLRADAEKATLAAQAEEIKARRAQIIAVERNSIAVDRNTLEREKSQLSDDAAPELFEALKKRTQELTARETNLEKIANVSGGGAYKSLAAENTKTNIVPAQSLELAQRLDASAAALNAIRAQLAAVDLQAIDATIKNQFETQGKLLDIDIKSLASKKQGLLVNKDIFSETNAAAVIARQALETQEAELAYKKDSLAIASSLASFSALREKADAKTQGLIDKEIEKLKDQKKLTDSIYLDTTATRELSNRLELITVNAKVLKQEQEDRYKTDQFILSIQDQVLDAAQQELELKKSSGSLAEKEYIERKNTVELNKLSLANDKEIKAAKQAQTLALLEQEAVEKRLAVAKAARIQKDLAAAFDSGDSGAIERAVQSTEFEIAAEQQVLAERERINQSYRNTITLANGVYDISVQNANKQKELALYQEQWNQAMLKTQGIAESLAGAFDTFGKAIGDSLIIFQTLSKSQEEYNLKIKDQKDLAENAFANAARYDEAGNVGAATKEREKGNTALERSGELEEDRRKDELRGNAKIVGSVKTMFKEKTGAYRALDAIQKVMHVAALARDVKTMISDGMVMVSSVAKSMTSASAAGTEAVAKAYAAPWPLGFASGAAMAAIIGALLGKAFGGGGGGGFVPTAEQQQKVQGTGTAYDSQGKIVETGRGVFGDPEAKNEGIARSIDIIKDNAVIGLKYDNKALQYLEEIRDGIKAAAKNLFGITGLRTGSMFGTTEGTQSRGGVAGFLGGTRTTTIIDSGIRILDAGFNDLADGVAGAALQFYETVETTKKSVLRTKTRTNTNFKEASDELVDYFANVFSTGRDLFFELADQLGMSESIVTEKLANFKFTGEQLVSLRGLKGQEFVDELNAITGNLLGEVASELFPQLERFQEFGEDFLQTAIRVTDTNAKVEQQLYNLGLGRLTDILTASGITVQEVDAATNAVVNSFTSTDPAQIRLAAIEITEGLVELAGGLDNFLSVTNQYMENFMTEAERDALQMDETYGRLNSLSEESPLLGQALDSLGLSLDRTADNALDTREEFASVVNALKNSGVAGMKLAYQLMEVSGGFAEFTEAIDEGVSELITNIPKKIDDINAQIKKLERPGYEAGNAFWGLVDSLDEMYQTLVQNNDVTTENVEAIIALTEAQKSLIIAQNQRKTEEQLAAFELEAATQKLSGFAQQVANIASKSASLVRAMVDLGTATQDNIDRVTAAARVMYDAAQAENALRAEQILVGFSAQTASLGLSQFAREIQGIESAVLSAAQQLADLGQLTEGAIDQLLSGARTQLEFAQQQNQQQAQNILAGFAKETANQGLSQLAQQIQSVRDKTRSAIEQLAQLGQATEENIAALVALAEQQVEVIQAQSARQAQELILAKNTELLSRNLGQLGQELFGIAQQAQDAARQLVDLGQATDENIAAIRAWQAAMIESAKAARLSAQEQQYAELFAGSATATLTAKFNSLGFSMPANIQQFQQLIDAIDTTTIAGIDLRGQLLDLGSEFTSLVEQVSGALRSAYDARVGELTDARDRFQDFADTLKDFKTSLLTGALSPLTPAQQYEVNRQEFLRVSALAQTGDVQAIEQLQSASSSFLESSRTMFASSEAYTQDFGLVTAALDSTMSVAEIQVEIANNTLTEIRNLVGGLIDLTDVAANSDVVLTGVGAELERAIADYTGVLNSTTVDISNLEVTAANRQNDLLQSSLFVQGLIDSGISSVVSTAQEVDTSIGDVATGITNMAADIDTALAGLGTKLDTIAEKQEPADFSAVVTAINEAAADKESPTIQALRALGDLQLELLQKAKEADDERLRTQTDRVVEGLNAILTVLLPTATPTPTSDPTVTQATDNWAAYWSNWSLQGEGGQSYAGPNAPLDFSGYNDTGMYYQPLPDYSNVYDTGAAGGGFAKGAAFMGGLEMFARGGIVESPTLFKFARGAGLMGEAGPEAIMPLRRDGRGNLGIIAQQNNDELLAEIARLNEQVQQLANIVAQGAIINAQATDRNTEAITTTIKDTSVEQQYMKKIQSRTSIV